MIDFVNAYTDSATFVEREAGHSEKTIDSYHRDLGKSGLELPDKVRELVALNPSLCVSAAFLAGGILGWMTSRR